MKLNRLAPVPMCALLIACAANSGVVPLGGGAFMVSRQAATGFGGTGNIKAKALQDAAGYCSAKGQDFEVTNATQNEGPFVLGKYPRAEVTFRCVPQK